ncbi:MAG: DUF6527 family protein [Reyranella sp.]|nr:DUF6527 family protein [Reyranella sp.]
MTFLSFVTSCRDRCMRTIGHLTRRGLEWTGFLESAQLTVTTHSDHPDIEALPPGIIYVVGGPTYQKWAFLKCPCGCGEPIMLSLSEKKRPRWHIDTDWFGRPTVKPSVWQTAGCYSHFWIKKGRIHWTADTGRPHASRVGSEG